MLAFLGNFGDSKVLIVWDITFILVEYRSQNILQKINFYRLLKCILKSANAIIGSELFSLKLNEIAWDSRKQNFMDPTSRNRNYGIFKCVTFNRLVPTRGTHVL